MSTRVLSPNDPICYLTQAQREHLKKSTRKLAKVLGTTPMLRVVDAQRRSDLGGALEPSIQAQQVESAVKITCSIDAALQGAPRLRFLATQPCQDSGVRVLSSPQTLLIRSPLSASLITPSSATSRRASFFPATPVSPYGEPRTSRTSGLTAHERRLQRKRLSKLSRTLGQAVPPVLVTPARRRASRQYSSRRRRRSLYVIIDSPAPDFPQSASSGAQASDILHDLTEEEASSAASFAPLPTVWQALPAQTEDEDVGKIPHIAEEDAELSTPPLNNEDEPRRSSRARARPVSMTLKSPVTPHLQRSHSEEPGARVPDSDDSRGGLTAAERTRLQEELPSRSGSRIAQIFYRKLNAQDSPEHERYERAVAHRRERRQGWSGEWNAASVQEVIVKLRDL